MWSALFACDHVASIVSRLPAIPAAEHVYSQPLLYRVQSASLHRCGISQTCSAGDPGHSIYPAGGFVGTGCATSATQQIRRGPTDRHPQSHAGVVPSCRAVQQMLPVPPTAGAVQALEPIQKLSGHQERTPTSSWTYDLSILSFATASLGCKLLRNKF